MADTSPDGAAASSEGAEPEVSGPVDGASVDSAGMVGASAGVSGASARALGASAGVSGSVDGVSRDSAGVSGEPDGGVVVSGVPVGADADEGCRPSEYDEPGDAAPDRDELLKLTWGRFGAPAGWPPALKMKIGRGR